MHEEARETFKVEKEKEKKGVVHFASLVWSD